MYRPVMKVKQVRWCGVFRTESACKTWLTLAAGFTATTLLLALAIFNLSNTLSSDATNQASALTKDLDRLMQELREARSILNTYVNQSSSDQSSIAEDMLRLEMSLKSLKQLLKVDNGSELLEAEGSGAENTTGPTPAPTVVHIYQNCSMEMLSECTVSHSSLTQSTMPPNITFSRCSKTYTRGDDPLDTPQNHLSNLFCSVQTTTAGNFTFPVTSSLRIEDDNWSCACYGYKIEGVEFTDFDCRMYGTFCPIDFTLPASAPLPC